MSDLSAGSWVIIGSSVQGASHKRSGLPNQDAIFAHPRIDVAPAMAVASSSSHFSCVGRARQLQEL
jgi:hypothetical protein